MFEKIVTFIITIDIAQKSIENALPNTGNKELNILFFSFLSLGEKFFTNYGENFSNLRYKIKLTRC